MNIKLLIEYHFLDFVTLLCLDSYYIIKYLPLHTHSQDNVCLKSFSSNHKITFSLSPTVCEFSSHQVSYRKGFNFPSSFFYLMD